jgi:hypothetical protein
MGETTQFIRKVRHWKTTLAGSALMFIPVAYSIWPEHSALISKISVGLTAAGMFVAADGSKTNGTEPTNPPKS